MSIARTRAWCRERFVDLSTHWASERGAWLLLLAAAAGSTLWWLQLGNAERRDLAQVHEPDYFMENFTRSQMDDFGRLHHHLRADLLLHYPDDGSTELVRPHLQVYNDDEPLAAVGENPAREAPWQVQSEKGWINAHNDVLLLQGAVTIWRDGLNGVRELEVHTRDVRVLPNQRYAETAAAARIRAPDVEYTGVGLRARFNEKKIELLKQVRGKHGTAVKTT